MIRVVLADDHNLVRQGIRALLEKADDIQVVGEASDGLEAIELVQQFEPDVLVMDIAMPRLNGIEATARIQTLKSSTQVVMLSMHADEMLVREALRSGARGYLLKRSVVEELLLAVRAAQQRQVFLSPAVSQFVVSEMLAQSDDEASGFDLLTPREREVLQLVAEGHTNPEMAALLQVSVKTIEKHRASVMSKLEVRDVAGLTREAIKHKLVFLE